MNIGKAIKLRRATIGIGQKELSSRTGLSVSYISLIERDKRDPSLSTLQKMANGLNIQLETLFYLGADSDGLEKINPELSERLVSYAFQRIIKV